MNTLNGARVLTAKVYVPWNGAWVADVSVDLEPGQPMPSGRCVLTLLETVLQGTATTDATGREGQTVKVRVVGGAGWTKLVPEQHHTLPGGVMLSTVLLALAAETGEPVTVLADEVVGKHYTRRGGIASQALEGRSWWVDFAGMTNVGPRPPAAPPAGLEVLSFDPTTQTVTAGVDAISQPGFPVVTVQESAPLTVRAIEYDIDASTARATLQIATQAPRVDRLQDALRRLVGDEGAFRAAYEYRVVASSDGLTELARDPDPRAVNPLPSMVKIASMPGAPGLDAKLTPGTKALVSFADGDRTKPYVTHYQGADQDGYLPLSLSLDATLLLELGKTASGGVEVGGSGAEPVALAAPIGDWAKLVETAINTLAPGTFSPLNSLAAGKHVAKKLRTT